MVLLMGLVDCFTAWDPMGSITILHHHRVVSCRVEKSSQIYNKAIFWMGFFSNPKGMNMFQSEVIEHSYPSTWI